MPCKLLFTFVCALFILPSYESLASTVPSHPAHSFIFKKLDKRSDTLTGIFALNSSSAEANHWLGADADTSIFLNQTTSLWLFGDTLFGGYDARTNTRQCTQDGGRWNVSCGFAHSTIGVLSQTSSEEKHERVTYEMEYFVNRSKDGQPVSFFQPPNASDPAYWWVVAGVASYSTQDIVLMAQVIVPAAPACGGFGVLGTSLISIDNVADPPLDWTYHSLQLPHTDACTNWFVGMTHSDGKDSDLAYILGTNGEQSYDANGCAVCSNSSVVLARANITDLRRLRWDSEVEFWCESATSATTSTKSSSSSSSSFSGTKSGGGKWSKTCPNAQLRPLFTPTDCGAPNCAISEMSLFYNFYLGRWYAFAVQGFGPDINFWFSESSDVTSSWASQTVYVATPSRSLARFPSKQL